MENISKNTEQNLNNNKIILTAEHPEYFNVQNKQKSISDFLPKVEKVNKFVIDEGKEFFNRIQWISGGAISLSVPLLTNIKSKGVEIFFGKLYLTNILFLALAWILFVFSFLFAIYRNKIHPEYIQADVYSMWQKINRELVESKSKIFPKEDDLKTNINQIKDIQSENDKQKKILWNRSESFGRLSQVCLISGIILFVIFGLLTLFL